MVEEYIMKQGIKEARKTKRIMIVTIVILISVFFLIGATYVEFGDDMKKISEKNSKVKSSVSSDGQVVYNQTIINEHGEEEQIPVSTDDIADDFSSVLKGYINADDSEYSEKIKYLIEAEVATKTPYTDKNTIGRVKFYRYDNVADTTKTFINEGEENETLNTAYQLTFIDKSKFAELKEKFLESGDETVFNHFTMNSDGDVVIAYGRKEIKTITTNGDADLTQESVREFSGDDLYRGNYKEGFTAERYTIKENTIDYLSMIEQYIMPSNLLYALLIQTRDIEFVEEIAALAYDTEIGIGIYDNESISYTEELYNYNKSMELNTNIELNYIKVFDISNPSINLADLADKAEPEKTPSNCNTVLNESTSQHQINYKNANVENVNIENNLYVKAEDNNGITELVKKDSAKQFETKYRIDVDAKSSPTVGIVFANTWIAKWKSTYTKETNPYGPYNDSDSMERSEIEKYSNKEDFINAFAGTLKTDIANKLNEHAIQLVNSAVNAVYLNELDEVEYEKLTVSQLTEDAKLKILADHIGKCTSCKDIIEDKKIDDDKIYVETTNKDGKLKGTQVEKHYNSALTTYIDGINNKREEEARAKFKAKIEETGRITYEQTLEGAKNNVNITFAIENGRTSTTYKKDETIERAKDGEKFSEIFNDSDFYDARGAIIARDAWFWEYIELNEDTRKLENVLRYLLNIATGTTDYITDFEFETMFDNLFKDKYNTLNGGIGDLSILRELINYFEGSGPKETIDGVECYVAYADTLAGGLATIGHGITTYQMELFPEEYKGWAVGSKIPVTVVDEVQEQTLKNYLDTVKSRFPDATAYQSIAIASAGYNCGPGFYDGIQECFKKYIENSEDKYGEQVDQVKAAEYIIRLQNGEDAVQIKQELINEINCSLYTESWALYVNSTTASNIPGLIKRRYIEWLMFQYGYLYPTNSYYTDSDENEIQQKIAHIAQNSDDYAIVPRANFCLGWVYDVYVAAGAERGNKGCAFCAGREYGVSTDFTNIPLGACVYGEGVGDAGYKFGHVGIYIGDGKVADNIGYIRIMPLEDWRKENPDGCWGWACDTPVNSAYPITKGLIHSHREPCM